jgi:threonine dehydrogenase-like Zn-dependent dehydrogenase
VRRHPGVDDAGDSGNLPTLIDLILEGTIDPGKVFDLTLPLPEVAEGYRAMDERRAIKTLLQP